MSKHTFVDLLTVKTGNGIEIAQFHHDIVREGGVVELDNGSLGIVLTTAFVEVGSSDYNRIAARTPIRIAMNYYRHDRSREDFDDASS